MTSSFDIPKEMVGRNFHFFATPEQYRAWVILPGTIEQHTSIEDWAISFGLDFDELWPADRDEEFEVDAYTNFVPQYRGEIYGPDLHEYPVVVYFVRGDSFDRVGDLHVEILDWASVPR